MERVWIGIIVLIILVAIGAFCYWWYFTPRIIAERSTNFYVANITFWDNEADKVVNETIMNVTYKGSMCEVEQIKFSRILSEDNVNSIFSMANVIQFTKNGSSISGYIEFNLKKLNGPFTDGIALWKGKIILIFFCEQTESNEYIARWFVEKYE